MSRVIVPQSEAEAGEIIRDFADRGAALAIGGGFTRTGFGNLTAVEARLKTAALSGILAYNPAEMVMTARAGTPVAEIEAALAAAGQMMGFEPIDHRGVMGTEGEPTIGGVVSVNGSGPRRITVGAARDALLGVALINGRGEAVRAGGRVMKNVTGLDLARLMAGAHGTLGLLTEVTFRVLPNPKSAATLVVSGLGDPEAAVVMAAAMAMPLDVSGAAHLPQTVRSRFLGGSLPGGEATVLRLEGDAASLEERMAALTAHLAPFGPMTVLGPEESATLWREIRDVKPYADGSQRPVWRVSVAPTHGAPLVAALRLEAGIDAFYDWQGGLVWMRMEADAEAEPLRRLTKSVGGGHATLIRASATARKGLSAFEPLSPVEALLSARIKASFDPAGIFAPGHMAPLAAVPSPAA